MNKTPSKRRIKIIFDDAVMYVESWMGWICINGNSHYDEVRKIAIENIYWLLGMDVNDLETQSIWNNDSNVLNKDFLNNKINQWIGSRYNKFNYLYPEECAYLSENMISDYYKNKDKYPSSVDIRKIYNF